MKLADARDFVRLHPDEESYWSAEFCFVNVPVKGQKRDTLHLIDEDIAEAFLPQGKVLRHRLALATKPYDTLFLAIVPSQNLDNEWNADCLRGCHEAKGNWVQLVSMRDEGRDGYRLQLARNANAFPAPRWPTQPLPQIIEGAFRGRFIADENSPALARLIGGAVLQ
jgi:hypothetical protein